MKHTYVRSSLFSLAKPSKLSSQNALVISRARSGRKLKKITESLKDNGSIYLWDMNKTRGEVVDYKIKVILPNNKIKEGVIKNLNPLISCNFEEIKKILSKYYIIKEEKQWEDVFFLNGVKKKDIKSEDII